MVKCRGVQPNGSRSHTPGGVGRKGRRHMYSGELGEKQARTQVNRRRALSIHVLTCRLGLGCKVIQGATQFSVDSWEWDAFIRSPAVAPRAGGGLNIHVQLPGQGGLL